jgi:hypothetical protein
MATKIIILETKKGSGNDLVVRYSFWLYPAAGREVPKDSTTKSVWRDATAGDNANLVSGVVVEEVRTTQLPLGFSTAQVGAALRDEYNARAVEFAAEISPNLYYGTTYDGTSWTVVQHP